MIAAVVPVKRLRDAKSRLAPDISIDDRAAVALQLARTVVKAIKESGVIDRLAVVTPEEHLADTLGVEVLPDAGGLNASLERAAEWVVEIGAGSLLIVPADLPLLRPEDVAALIADSGGLEGIAICRTHDGGTGALLLCPPDVIPPAFGRDSFDAHIALAREREKQVRTISIAAFESDLDRLDDLRLLGTSGKR